MDGPFLKFSSFIPANSCLKRVQEYVMTMGSSTLYPPPSAFMNGRLSNRTSAILNAGVCSLI